MSDRVVRKPNSLKKSELSPDFCRGEYTVALPDDHGVGHGPPESPEEDDQLELVRYPVFSVSVQQPAEHQDGEGPGDVAEEG